MKIIEIEIANENSLEAKATGYFLSASEKLPQSSKRPVVIIAPGGGYHKVSFKEGEPIALKFNSLGYHAIVVDYSVYPAAYPTALREMDSVFAWVLANCDNWNIDHQRIYLCGFSAGGHLVANYAVEYQRLFCRDTRIKGIVLGYPVITARSFRHQGSFENLLQENFELLQENVSMEEVIDENFPETFVFTTVDDQTVPVQNTLLLVNRLVEVGVRVEAHLFPSGVHGLALANEVTKSAPEYRNDAVAAWFGLLETWLEQR